MRDRSYAKPTAGRASARAIIDRVRYTLPHGQGLPESIWRQRQRAMLALVFLHAAAIPAFGMAQGYGPLHSVAEGSIVAVLGVFAAFTKGRQIAAGIVSTALLTSSALIVHFSHGAIEAHFHFFVMIVVLTLYEDWVPFMVAVAYVALHHGIGGALDSASVYNHRDAIEHPWKWAAIHAGFVAAAGAAAVTAWRLNEDVRHRLAAIVDSSSDAIVAKTLTGAIASWNAGAEELYGYSAKEAIGRPMELLVPAQRRAEEQEVFARAREGEGIDNYETQRLRRDGRLVDVSLTVSPIRDTTGRINGTSTIARDISERRRADEELKRANEEADRLKEEFFALVSHDLRTPLASIKGYSELLATGDAGELPERARQFVEVIERNTSRLERLVGDLLFAAQAEAGGFALERSEVDLSELVSYCVEAAKPPAEEKNVGLDLQVADAVVCRGDEGRLAQLLDNLISNAVKYTPAGGQIQVVLARRSSQAVIEVRDTGMGIPAQEQELLFNRFFRSSSSIAEAIPGVGLGLTIVKAIAEAHGGTIEVESEEGLGTTFRVLLPGSLMPARRGVSTA